MTDEMDDFQDAPRFFYAEDALGKEIVDAKMKLKEFLKYAEQDRHRAKQNADMATYWQNYLTRLNDELRDLKAIRDTK